MLVLGGINCKIHGTLSTKKIRNRSWWNSQKAGYSVSGEPWLQQRVALLSITRHEQKQQNNVMFVCGPLKSWQKNSLFVWITYIYIYTHLEPNWPPLSGVGKIAWDARKWRWIGIPEPRNGEIRDAQFHIPLLRLPTKIHLRYTPEN